MQHFVITLSSEDQERKNNVFKQFKKIEAEPFFFEGVNGFKLSETERQEVTIETNFLTPGEIGCALSHLKIYQTMIDENIPYALVFEDDIVFSDLVTSEILNDLERFIKNRPADKSTVLALFDSNFKGKIVQKINTEISIRKPVNGFCAHAYLINLEAAKNILHIQTPVKFEIDAWKHYIYLHQLTLFCTTPSLVIQSDSIESIIDQQKRHYGDKNRRKLKKENFNLLFKELSWKDKLKTYLFRIYKNTF